MLDSAAQVTEVMSEDAEEQRSLLAIGGEPRNAIVECWGPLRAAGRAGRGRSAAAMADHGRVRVETLDLVGGDRGAVARLADLYREARFSDHPMTHVHRSQALDEISTSSTAACGTMAVR